jgi:nicotinate-nucleotide adenylyltransferase
MAKQLSIGILAGSFDPIHAGHLAAAYGAASAAGLDRVFFMVEQRPRHKQGVKAFEHRSEMVRLAISDIDLFGQLVLDHPQFTVAATIPTLRRRFQSEELYLIMGDDVSRRLAHWPDIDVLLGEVKIIAIPRLLPPDKIRQQLSSLEVVTATSSSYVIGERTHVGVSSSKIRAALKKGEAVDTLHPRVLAYIQQHGLYGSSGLGS